ncbi:putative ferric uptake regulator family protein [Magnetofaba australis IT-1]|uniref:Putative ferric uptake regulator family protein n=1 Tax=Magnetofaba australis IT-1 TaxID=1434232 RepID=A0A1Y2K119_9PROT|nr:putative ferric uptake regulator family protein [Magnetofaba australis IT-1]
MLEILALSHAAMGAYEILDRYAEDGKRAAPATIYRALEFLLELGLIHRIASLNAYVACPARQTHDPAALLVCDACGVVSEIPSERGMESLRAQADALGFSIRALVLEAHGLCPNCRAQTPQAPGADH